MADMMVLNSRTNCGPIRLSGGLSNVIRQYAGDVRLILICAALVTVLITTSSSRGPITRWHYTRRHESHLLDVGIAPGEDPRAGAAQKSAPVIERSERMIGHRIVVVVQPGFHFS